MGLAYNGWKLKQPTEMPESALSKRWVPDPYGIKGRRLNYNISIENESFAFCVNSHYMLCCDVVRLDEGRGAKIEIMEC